MQVGDLVKIKNLHPDWGKVGLITRIVYDGNGFGQISLLSSGGLSGAIPWYKREHYLEVICK